MPSVTRSPRSSAPIPRLDAQFTLALVGGLDSERLETLDLSLGASAGAIGAGIVIVAFSVLTVRKLARIDVP